jgi:glycosyltransferase involved in cell wall biosynthesis
MPKLSIITINYNNLEGLKRTVESVVNQTWQEFEYIIIDGGSTDGSAAYIESQSAHFDYWVSEPDKGIYNAMNKGIAKATGEYLLFLNSGDHLYDLKVLEQNHNKINEQDIIYFNVVLIGENDSTTLKYPEKINFSFFFEGTICHQVVMINKKLFNEVGMYDESLKIASDWKFFIIAFLKFNCTSKRVDKVLTNYTLDGFSSNRENNKLLQFERQKVLNEEFEVFVKDYEQMRELRQIVSSLRKSRKINLLIRLGLINKF